MKILGISGSPRAGAAAAGILAAVGTLAGSAIEMTIYESLMELPHFSPESDVEPSPAEVARLRGLLRDAEAVIICTPEYAFSMPSVLKNALEWSVSSGEINEKPVATISTSPLYGGGELAHNELSMVLKAVGARIPERGSVTVRNTRKRMSQEGEITDPELASELRRLSEALISAVEQRRSELQD
jgi:chromate reductase, NAD(P)H dehydrogenase (quinone)